MPSFTNAELRSEIDRLEELRAALVASREYSLNLTPDELRVAKYFHYQKHDLYMPIWSEEAALKLVDTERHLVLLRAELAARHEDGGEV